MQKITPFLWFDKNCEEAINFYVSVFNNAQVLSVKRYPEGPLEGPMKGMEGKVLTAVFELEDQKFMALDGGPYFKFNPTISFTISCTTPEEVDSYWDKLIEEGSVLMPVQKWPFSERYGWLQDKYGVSWQIGVVGQFKEKISPSLMFVGDKFGKCEEAINLYLSIFKNSSIEFISHYEPGEHDQEGKVKYSSFTLDGKHFTAMESSLGHKFTAGGAISMYVEVDTQDEVDYYWDKLSEGGNPKSQQCGWLQDKYGFSWQIIPKALPQYLNHPSKSKADKAMQAMLKMKKIIIADLEKAVE